MATDSLSSGAIFVLPAELRPAVDHLVTEDGKPVDNQFSEKQMRLLTETLYNSWIDTAGQRSFVAMANVGLFFDVHRQPLVPDVLLSMEVKPPAEIDPKRRRSYFTWEYGKVPDVVIEIVSNREGGEDTTKLDGYAEIGIPDYAIFDPDRLLGPELLRVYRLVEGEYCKMQEPIWFPKVGLGLRLWHGTFEEWDNTWLRWVDANGQPIPTGRERAEEAEHRADSEQQRAEAQRRRADQLAEQLRQLGIEPTAP